MNRRELIAGLGAAIAVATLPAIASASESYHWTKDPKVVQLLEEVKASTIPLLHSGLFECNSNRTRKMFRHSASKLFLAARKEGVIHDFRVVCNRTNNTKEVIANSEFVVDYFVKPRKNGQVIMLSFIMATNSMAWNTVFSRDTTLHVGHSSGFLEEHQDPYARKHWPSAIDVDIPYETTLYG